VTCERTAAAYRLILLDLLSLLTLLSNAGLAASFVCTRACLFVNLVAFAVCAVIGELMPILSEVSAGEDVDSKISRAVIPKANSKGQLHDASLDL